MTGRRRTAPSHWWPLIVGAILLVVGFVFVNASDRSWPRLVVGTLLCLAAVVILQWDL